MFGKSQKAYWLPKTSSGTSTATSMPFRVSQNSSLKASKTFWIAAPTPVFERQKRLEKRGYIKKYVAILDPEKLNMGLQVFCKVKLTQINHEIADAFTRRIMRIPEVTECYNTSGAYDYLLKVRAKDMKQYQEFVLTKLGDIDHVGAIESTFVMNEVKQNYGINI